MRKFVIVAAVAVSGVASIGAAWAGSASAGAAKTTDAAKPAAAAKTAGAAKTEEPGFLFDALRSYRFKMSWEKLVKTVDPTPDWLLRFERDYEGAAGEMTPITLGGKAYKISYVCKAEDCLAHRFAVLFDADGARAYGALGGKDEPPAFFGAPDAAEQDALTKALHPVAAAQTSAPKSP